MFKRLLVDKCLTFSRQVQVPRDPPRGRGQRHPEPLLRRRGPRGQPGRLRLAERPPMARQSRPGMN